MLATSPPLSEQLCTTENALSKLLKGMRLSATLPRLQSSTLQFRELCGAVLQQVASHAGHPQVSQCRN